MFSPRATLFHGEVVLNTFLLFLSLLHFKEGLCTYLLLWQNSAKIVQFCFLEHLGRLQISACVGLSPFLTCPS